MPIGVHESEPRPRRFETATRFRRVLGGIVDAVFVLGIGTIVGRFMAGRSADTTHLVHVLASQTVQGLLVAARGQSVGKLLVGTRIVRADGHPAGLLQGFLLRTFPYPLVGIVAPTQFAFIVGVVALLDHSLLFGASRRCGHDVLAQTFVELVPGAIGASKKRKRKNGERRPKGDATNAPRRTRADRPRRAAVQLPFPLPVIETSGRPTVHSSGRELAVSGEDVLDGGVPCREVFTAALERWRAWKVVTVSEGGKVFGRSAPVTDVEYRCEGPYELRDLKRRIADALAAGPDDAWNGAESREAVEAAVAAASTFDELIEALRLADPP